MALGEENSSPALDGRSRSIAMTLRIGISGIRGRMGREIAAVAAHDPNIEVTGGLARRLDARSWERSPVRVVSNLAELLPDVDVLIDFTVPEGSVAHASACAAAGVPLVCGTTGLGETHMADLCVAAERVAVFHAANMSPGVNAALAVLPALLRALQGYDIEFVEAHHRHKADAPSGTALALARAVADAS